MNLSNAVYNFAVSLVGNPANTALYGAIAHADLYEEMKGAPGVKYVRVDDVRGSVPQPVAPNVLKEFNAFLDVHFLQIPQTQGLTDRLNARNKTDAMALEFIQAIYDDQRLGTNNCNIISDCSVQKVNDWRRVGTLKTPIAVVRLTINKK